MLNNISKWAELSGSYCNPIPGDLVHVMPRGTMAGYVMCGATYMGGYQVPSSEDTLSHEEPSAVVHEVLFHGNIVTISSRSHMIQVIGKDG